MSADNWGTCPRCKDALEQKRLAAREKLLATYGKVSPEEWECNAEALEGLEDPTTTLREDYEIFTDAEGEFYISYSCHCAECGFSHRFEYTKQLDVQP